MFLSSSSLARWMSEHRGTTLVTIDELVAEPSQTGGWKLPLLLLRFNHQGHCQAVWNFLCANQLSLHWFSPVWWASCCCFNYCVVLTQTCRFSTRSQLRKYNTSFIQCYYNNIPSVWWKFSPVCSSPTYHWPLSIWKWCTPRCHNSSTHFVTSSNIPAILHVAQVWKFRNSIPFLPTPYS